jgi:riboflavin transporter FmnP
MTSRIRKLVLVAVFAALAYVVTAVIRVSVFTFLTYDPKDAIIGIAGFILGPIAASCISIIVAALEVPLSGTGIIGFVMNAIASIAFIGTASLIYQRKPSLKNAIIGILAGLVTMTVSMLILNYLLTPLYMGVPRAEVAKLLAPVLLPFNLMKSGINGALILLLYKPVMKALEIVGFDIAKAPSDSRV